MRLHTRLASETTLTCLDSLQIQLKLMHVVNPFLAQPAPRLTPNVRCLLRNGSCKSVFTKSTTPFLKFTRSYALGLQACVIPPAP